MFIVQPTFAQPPSKYYTSTYLGSKELDKEVSELAAGPATGPATPGGLLVLVLGGVNVKAQRGALPDISDV